jgi:cell division protein ZapA (FtsZ GTPase activity inhibitor)
MYISGNDDPEKVRWEMSSEDYVKQAVSDVDTELHKVHKCLPSYTVHTCQRRCHKVITLNWMDRLNLMQDEGSITTRV